MPPDDVRLETLLAESDWLRALARRLCADPHQAEDLAQETWLRALRRMPDTRRSPRAWLARVLFNLNISRARSEARRSRHERGVARAEAQASGADVVERDQVARTLAEHVLALDEPGRSAILARFFEELDVEEIARRQSKPTAEVRAELRAGLEDLRRRLEHSEGAEWLATLVPLIRPAESPVRAPRGLRKAPASLAAAALLLSGTATLIGLARLRSGSAPPAPGPVVLAAEDARAGIDAQLETASQRRAAGATPLEQDARTAGSVHPVPPRLAAGSIDGVVLRRAGEQDSPIEGARVLLWDYAEGCLYGLERLRAETATELAPVSQTRSGNEGDFRFPRLEPRDYLVGAVVPGMSLRTAYVKVDEPAEPRVHARRLAIVLGDASLHGCVRDEDGLPLAGVLVNLYRVPRFEPNSPNSEGLCVSTDTGADGRYAIDALPAGSYMLTVADGKAEHWPGRRGTLDLIAADSVEFDVGEPFPAPHYRGTLVCAQGEPTTSPGELQLRRRQETPRGSKLDILRAAPLAAGGRFDATLECARWIPTAMLAWAPQRKHEFEAVEVGRDGLERDLGLPGARVHGRVLDAATRQPPAGCAKGLQARLRRPGAKPAANGAPLDAQGRFVFDTLEPGKWELTVESIVTDAQDHYEVAMEGPDRWELISAPRPPAAGAAVLEFTIDPEERERELLFYWRAP